VVEAEAEAEEEGEEECRRLEQERDELEWQLRHEYEKRLAEASRITQKLLQLSYALQAHNTPAETEASHQVEGGGVSRSEGGSGGRDGEKRGAHLRAISVSEGEEGQAQSGEEEGSEGEGSEGGVSRSEGGEAWGVGSGGSTLPPPLNVTESLEVLRGATLCVSWSERSYSREVLLYVC
jgi:hypothetical protein